MENTTKGNLEGRRSLKMIVKSDPVRADGKPMSMSEKSVVGDVYERTRANALTFEIIAARDEISDLREKIVKNESVLQELGFHPRGNILGVVRGGKAHGLITKGLEQARQSSQKSKAVTCRGLNSSQVTGLFKLYS